MLSLVQEVNESECINCQVFVCERQLCALSVRQGGYLRWQILKIWQSRKQ